MLKRIASHEALIAALVALITGIAYVLTTFATVDYVDKRHVEVKDVLLKMDTHLESIDARLWELNKKQGDK
mgnify:CR=1 FL=1